MTSGRGCPAPLSSTLWADLVGRKFRLHGRGPDAYDCLGVVLELHRRRGIELTDLVTASPYSGALAEQSQRFTDYLAATTRWQSCQIEPGAVLLFRHNNAPSHVGVAIDHDRFIHATETIGQVVVSRLDGGFPPYRRFLLGAFRYAV